MSWDKNVPVSTPSAFNSVNNSFNFSLFDEFCAQTPPPAVLASTPHDGPALPGDKGAVGGDFCVCDAWFGTDRAIGLCPSKLSDSIECDVWIFRVLLAHPICILVVDDEAASCCVVNDCVVNDFGDDGTSYVQIDGNDANTEFEGSLRRRLERILQWETACLCIVESNNFH